MKILRILALALIIPVAAWAMQRAPAPASSSVGATPRVVTAANAFLASLDDAQRAAVSLHSIARSAPAGPIFPGRCSSERACDLAT
jgi:hypothetical protein